MYQRFGLIISILLLCFAAFASKADQGSNAKPIVFLSLKSVSNACPASAQDAAVAVRILADSYPVFLGEDVEFEDEIPDNCFMEIRPSTNSVPFFDHRDPRSIYLLHSRIGRYLLFCSLKLHC